MQAARLDVRMLALASLLAGIACAGAAPAPAPAALSPAPAATSASAAFALDSAVRAMSAAALWPGFDPLATPLAVFDGRNTVLFRHPHPPTGYVSLSRSAGAWAREGRDPAVTANTSAEIGGVPTATVMLRPGIDTSAATLGALAIHELFHVHQRRAHPAWAANEADLFTYPLDDAVALATRREETFALGEARASAEDADEAACWAADFTALRAARFARIGAAAAAYERGTELNEGLAHYVEMRARGGAPALPPGDFPVDRVRDRAYAVGASLATVLDQLQPGWRDTLDRAPEAERLSLDALLSRAAQRRRSPSSPQCSARDEQRARWTAAANADVEALASRRREARAAFLARPGWTLVVDAGGAAPLGLQGFDPLNVSLVSPAEILHSRFLKLGRGGSAIEVLGRAALSQGLPGRHPLFDGVRTLTITGLPVAPSMSDSAGVMVVTADGVHARFAKARASTDGRTVHVVMP